MLLLFFTTVLNTPPKIINSSFTSSLIHFPARICTNHAIFWCFLAAKKEIPVSELKLSPLSPYRESSLYNPVSEWSTVLWKNVSCLFRCFMALHGSFRYHNPNEKWSARNSMIYCEITILFYKLSNLCLEILYIQLIIDAIRTRTENYFDISFLIWQKHLSIKKFMTAGTNTPQDIK